MWCGVVCGGGLCLYLFYRLGTRQVATATAKQLQRIGKGGETTRAAAAVDWEDSSNNTNSIKTRGYEEQDSNHKDSSKQRIKRTKRTKGKFRERKVVIVIQLSVQ